METRRWTNPSQPRTLQIAVFLLYANAVINVLFLAVLFLPIFLLTIGYVASGYGIANDRRWGYWLGVGLAALGLLPFAWIIMNDGLGELFALPVLISAVFPVALFALLIHPESRDHQRIWFS
jgi:hypothetical protein